MKKLLQNQSIAEIISHMPIIKRLFFSVFGTVLLGFLFLSLLSYNMLDSAWSHVGARQEISNVGGRLGAWLADILHVFFGQAAWWLVVVLIYELTLLWWRRSDIMWQLRVLAYGFLLVCLSGLCAGWGMAGEQDTALLTGGVMGFELHQGLSHLLGTVVTTLFLIVITAAVMMLVFEVRPLTVFGGLLGWLGVEKTTASSAPDLPPPSEHHLFDIVDDGTSTQRAVKHTPESHGHDGGESLTEFLQSSGIRDEVMAQHARQQKEAHAHVSIQNTHRVEIYADEVVLRTPETSADDPNADNASESIPRTTHPHEGKHTTAYSLDGGHHESSLMHAPNGQVSQQLMTEDESVSMLNHDADELIIDPKHEMSITDRGMIHAKQHSDERGGHGDTDEDLMNPKAAFGSDDRNTRAVMDDDVDFVYQNSHTNQSTNIRHEEIFSDAWINLGDDVLDANHGFERGGFEQQSFKKTQTDLPTQTSHDDKEDDDKNHLSNKADDEPVEILDEIDEGIFELDDKSHEERASSAQALTNTLPTSRAMDTLSYRMSLSPIPDLSILDKPDVDKKPSYTKEELTQLSELLEIKLKEFNIKASVVSAMVGPVVTRFEVELAAGIKASRVTGAAQDLARSLSMASLRVVEVIPGKPYIGIEVPNKKREMVRLIELLDTPDYKNPDKQIGVAIGKDIGGKVVIADLAKAPHMLVAGTTGSGKSVFVNSILLSMLLKYSPDELKLVLIDPKQLELANYGDIPHLLTPVITDMTEATAALTWCVNEMERRYQLMSLLRVRKISEFNKKVIQADQAGEPIFDPLWRADENVSIKSAPKLKPLPLIVIVADEFADMIMQLGKTAEEPIVRLAQKARAAGIHLVLATQRPTVNVVTGLIKANIPSRVALRVNSKVDSRTIIEEGGAESMLGNGDMMFIGPGENTPQRVHGAYVDDDEVNRVCDAWRERGRPDYIDLSNSYTFEGEGSGEGLSRGGDDEYYHQAVTFVMESRKVSISSIQRKLGIGYNRAARIVDMMEEAGLVSPMDNSGKRQILM